ncbi:MAG: hypothetical protein D6775_02125, partial [Caldilineae bacterium]
LLISTRSDPPLALARLRARGLLAELRAADLRFGTEEAMRWLNARLPALSGEDALALTTKVEGWAAGLHLVLSSLMGQDPSRAKQVIATLHGTHHYLFEYLATEVFQRQPPPVQEFLLRTSVLPQLDADACNALPGVQRAQVMLEHLLRANLFISLLDENRRWYRYHRLFQEFLTERLRRERGDEYRLLCDAAGDYYAGQHDYELALQSYLQGGAHERAADVLQRLAPRYIEQGRVVVLQRYFNRLPHQYLRERPQLLLHQGDVLRRLGQPGPAIQRYEEALHAFESRQDAVFTSRALVRMGELARVQGNYPRARALVSQALRTALPEDHVNRAEALIALAKSHGFLTGMDQGRSLAEEALKEARLAGEKLSPLARANLLRSLGQICWWHGDPHSTVRYCQEALRVVPDPVSPIGARACISIATPYLYWGQLDTAMEYAERGLDIVQRLQLHELLPSAYATLGNVLTRLGEVARAEHTLRQALTLAQRLGVAAYERVMATGFLAYNLYGQGRVDEAWQLAEGALWSYTGPPDTYEIYVCRSVLADIALERNQIEIAEQLFWELVEVGERRQFRIPLAMVYFGLAYICLASGRAEEGLDHARRSLRLLEPTHSLQLYVDQGERARVVCAALREAGEQSLFLHKTLENLERNTPSIRVLNTSATPALRVRCLGNFRVELKGNEIRQDRWVSTKARDLLAYFITFRHERLTADRIVEALWPNTGAQAKRALPTALYRLRQALRTSDEATKFVLVEAGEYWLDTVRFQIDVDEFDTALAQARALESQHPEDSIRWYERAVACYGGEYLRNLYYDWVFPERRRLEQAMLAALNRLGALQVSNGAYEAALTVLTRSLEMDPLQEDIHCQVMRCYAALGDRVAVSRQFRLLEDALQKELGLAPRSTTVRLLQQLTV